MTVRLDFPSLPASPLLRADPRWKLAAFALAVAVVPFLRHLGPNALALAGALALVAAVRLPWDWYRDRLAVLAPLLLSLAVLLPLLLPDADAWRLGPLRLAPRGLAAAARVALKATTVLTLVLVLLASTPLPEVLHAAHALRVPGPVVRLLALTYRYLFLFAEELGRLRTALRVRGFRNRANLHGYRTVGHVTGILLVRSAERAERVGQAMRCRGYGGPFRSLREFRTGWGDVAVFAAVAGAAAGLLAWDVVLS